MNKKLPKGAYGEVSGKDYVPYITDKSRTGGNVDVPVSYTNHRAHETKAKIVFKHQLEKKKTTIKECIQHK
ncbi:hypothetical protein [Clostridioides difficile]|uniref:hypothetical protein n=1 Tax=Clostridioides difficile TaxID=1496 RepID=UPI000BB1C38C|nr:hypothetical protein [Clostridioides difficile]PBI58136.1 hypothetical protein BGU74_20875 [Clostridioides difficile]